MMEIISHAQNYANQIKNAKYCIKANNILLEQLKVKIYDTVSTSNLNDHDTIDKLLTLANRNSDVKETLKNQNELLVALEKDFDIMINHAHEQLSRAMLIKNEC